MENVTIEIKVLNDVMNKLASMPYAEVANLIASVHQSVDKCGRDKEAVPAQEAQDVGLSK